MTATLTNLVLESAAAIGTAALVLLALGVKREAHTAIRGWRVRRELTAVQRARDAELRVWERNW